MRVVEETEDRLIVYCPRKLMGDVFAAIFFSVGLVCLAVAGDTDPGPMITVMVASAVVFTGIGFFLFWHHSSAQVTLDAAGRTCTIRWRPLKGMEEVVVPFCDLASIDVHECDGDGSTSHTIQFTLTDGQKFLLENAYTHNLKVSPVVDKMRAWMAAHGASKFDAT